MNREAHAISHSREPAEIMGRTSVRHEAYEVLFDSRDGVHARNRGRHRDIRDVCSCARTSWRLLADALYAAHPSSRIGTVTLGARDVSKTCATPSSISRRRSRSATRSLRAYVAWLVELLRPRGIPPEHVGDTMRVLERVLTSELNSEHIAAVQPSVAAGLAAVPRGSA